MNSVSPIFLLPFYLPKGKDVPCFFYIKQRRIRKQFINSFFTRPDALFVPYKKKWGTVLLVQVEGDKKKKEGKDY